MRETGIRVGKVSSIDYETGMMRVTYKDKDGAVTANIPYANFNQEYSMPKIGESVLVAHLSNGSSRGVVIGTMWNQKNKPAENGETLYRKELSKNPGAAMIRYEDNAGEYLLRAPNIMVHGVNRTDLEGPEVHIAANIKTSFESPEHKASVQKITMSGLEEGNIEAEITSNTKIMMDAADLEAMIRNIELQTVENFKLSSEKAINIKSDEKMELTSKELILEDDKFMSTFNQLMERLEALDHDTSARK